MSAEDTFICDAALPGHAKTALIRNGYTTLGDLRGVDVAGVRGLGPRGAQAVAAAIAGADEDDEGGDAVAAAGIRWRAGPVALPPGTARRDWRDAVCAYCRGTIAKRRGRSGGGEPYVMAVCTRRGPQDPQAARPPEQEYVYFHERCYGALVGPVGPGGADPGEGGRP